MTENDEEKVKQAKELINKYRSEYAGIDPEVLRRLGELKFISNQTKQEQPDQAHKDIQERLGEAETGETLRIERWKLKVHCIYCGSKNIRRLPENEQKSKHIYKYQCLDCEECFNDDSQTEIEKGVPPLYSWMFCWYLLGCTNSLQYISQKLGLDLATIEMMVAHMQKLFKSQQPLKNFNSFDEWSIRQGGTYKKLLQESLEKTSELHMGYSVTQPNDDHEVRRQKDRATNPLKNKPGS